MKWLIKKSSPRFIFTICLLLIAAALPFIVDIALMSLFSKILIFGLFAMSLDLLVGYTALWSFGHAAFFGIAGYSIGLLMVRFDITNYPVVMPVTLFIVILITALFGFISLKVSGVYFLLVTLALGQVVSLIAFALYDITGGETGLANIPYPTFIHSDISYFYFVLIVCFISFAFLHFLVKSPFGQTLKGIREDETRMKCLGYHVWLHKYIAFIVAGLFAGESGILYAHFNGVMVPADAGILASGMPWLMVILGGAGTLWGGLIGSALILSMEYFISTLTPERWPLIIGVIFIAVVMVARQGILVWVRDFIKKRKR